MKPLLIKYTVREVASVRLLVWPLFRKLYTIKQKLVVSNARKREKKGVRNSNKSVWPKVSLLTKRIL